MNPMLAKLKGLKKSKELPEVEKEGKMAAIQSMGDLAKEAMGKKLGGLKKVTVASNSEEGLEKGLEKAKDIVEGSEDMEHEMEEMPEGEEMASEEPKVCDENSSPEEIDAEILRLMALKKDKQEA